MARRAWPRDRSGRQRSNVSLRIIRLLRQSILPGCVDHGQGFTEVHVNRPWPAVGCFLDLSRLPGDTAETPRLQFSPRIFAFPRGTDDEDSVDTPTGSLDSRGFVGQSGLGSASGDAETAPLSAGGRVPVGEATAWAGRVCRRAESIGNRAGRSRVAGQLSSAPRQGRARAIGLGRGRVRAGMALAEGPRVPCQPEDQPRGLGAEHLGSRASRWSARASGACSTACRPSTS